jgi:hypothetical protein
VRLEGELGSDLAALHHGVDIALSLSLLEAVLSGELRHEIVIVLSADRSWSENLPHFNRIIADDLPDPGGRLGFRNCRVRSNIFHVSISKINVIS